MMSFNLVWLSYIYPKNLILSLYIVFCWLAQKGEALNDQ